MRVLLIDDLPEMRRLVELWLEESPVRVVAQAASCEDVTSELIERYVPEVVVMDMNMPGRDGVECTRDLLARHPGLRVVAFSSNDDEGTEEAMRAAGAVAYFRKPELPRLVAWLNGLTQEG